MTLSVGVIRTKRDSLSLLLTPLQNRRPRAGKLIPVTATQTSYLLLPLNALTVLYIVLLCFSSVLKLAGHLFR